MKKIGLYVHIPFCRSKCLYCDFNSYENREADQEEYVKALIHEIALYHKKYNFRYKTVFIGGGTPTVINCALTGDLMERLAPYIIPGAEVTMEANPGTVSRERLEYYRSLGINRLSLGLQAWQEKLLRSVGRIHSREDFIQACQFAGNAGFDNISADLMFALPGQTMEMWEETLENVCRMDIDHVSCYSLKLEEGTGLYELHKAGKVQLPDEELDRDMYAKAVKILSSHGYSQYEISNFAKNGMECKHNLIYWKNGEYLGVGAGSHSRLENRRFWNYRDIDLYIKLVNQELLPVEGQEEISGDEDMWESIFLALRLNEGLDMTAFESKYQIDFMSRYGSAVSKLTAQGLVFVDADKLKLTDRGRDLSNSVFIEFM